MASEFAVGISAADTGITITRINTSAKFSIVTMVIYFTIAFTKYIITQ